MLPGAEAGSRQQNAGGHLLRSPARRRRRRLSLRPLAETQGRAHRVLFQLVFPSRVCPSQEPLQRVDRLSPALGRPTLEPASVGRQRLDDVLRIIERNAIRVKQPP